MKSHMSASQYRRWNTCAAAEAAAQRGEWSWPESDALNIGKYIDLSLLGGDVEAFKAEHPDMISSRGKTKGKLKATFRGAEQCITRVREEEKAMLLLTGKTHVAIDGEIDGVEWRGEIDCLPDSPFEGFFTDLKSRKNFDGTWHTYCGRNIKMPWYYDYIDQMAIYWHLLGRDRLPAVVAVAKQDPPELRAALFGAVKTLQERIDAIKARQTIIATYKDGSAEPPMCKEFSCPFCRREFIVEEFMDE